MINNKLLSRFELEFSSQIVYANYSFVNNIINIEYVFAPQELRGSGAASQLMQEISEFAKQNNNKINPICAYANVWLKKHKNYSHLIA